MQAGFYDNNGIGIAIVNCIGKVQINDSIFARNYLLNSTALLAGGGGVYIEFTSMFQAFQPALAIMSTISSHGTP